MGKLSTSLQVKDFSVLFHRAGVLLGGCHVSWTTKRLSGFVQKYVYHNGLNKSRKHKKAIL